MHSNCNKQFTFSRKSEQIAGISLVNLVCVIPKENSLNYYSSLLDKKNTTFTRETLASAYKNMSAKSLAGDIVVMVCK